MYSKTYTFPSVLQPSSTAGLKPFWTLTKSGGILHRIGCFFLVKKIPPPLAFLSATRDFNSAAGSRPSY